MAKKQAPAKVSDYGLTGKDSTLAVEKGLAEAAWYASPVSRARMRELLETTRSSGHPRYCIMVCAIGYLWFGWLSAMGYLVGCFLLCGVWGLVRHCF